MVAIFKPNAAEEEVMIRRLLETGYQWHPFAEDARELTLEDLPNLTLDDEPVRQMIQGYQMFNQQTFDHFALNQHQRIGIPDGRPGPATLDLLTIDRCEVPDFFPPGSGPQALGSGNWKECNGATGMHRCRVLLSAPPPSFLAEHFDFIWGEVCEAFAEQGLQLELLRAGQEFETRMEWSSARTGWIGLASLVNGARCNSRLFNRYNINYRPGNLRREWRTLIKHELLHNCGIGHKNGGVMNSSIVPGLGLSFNGDTSHREIVSRFGGQRVPIFGGGTTPPPPPPPPGAGKAVLDLPGGVTVRFAGALSPGDYEFVVQKRGGIEV